MRSFMTVVIRDNSRRVARARASPYPPGWLIAIRVGPYRILERLGAGGRGVAYLGGWKPEARFTRSRVISIERAPASGRGGGIPPMR
jgi:hypothetical protein